MSAESALKAGRKRAEALMVDTCTVVSRVRSTTFNEETGQYEMVDTPVYSGKCKFTAGGTGAHEIDAAGQDLVEQSATLALPVATSAEVDRDHIAKITASDLDPGLVGVELRIVMPWRQTYATARRFNVEETR